MGRFTEAEELWNSKYAETRGPWNEQIFTSSSEGQLYNYTVTPPSELTIAENSITVDRRTLLSDILTENMGCIDLAICIEGKRR